MLAMAVKMPSDMVVLPIFDAFVFMRRMDTIMSLTDITRAYIMLAECHNNLQQPMVHTNIPFVQRTYILACLRAILHDMRKCTTESLKSASRKCSTLKTYADNMCASMAYNGIGIDEDPIAMIAV